MLGPGGSSMNHKTFGNMIHPTVLPSVYDNKTSPSIFHVVYGYTQSLIHSFYHYREFILMEKSYLMELTKVTTRKDLEWRRQKMLNTKALGTKERKKATLK